MSYNRSCNKIKRQKKNKEIEKREDIINLEKTEDFPS